MVTFNYQVGRSRVGAGQRRGLRRDPDLLTIFGESAGGGSVAALLAMDRAPGPAGARRYRAALPAAARPSCTSWSIPTGCSDAVAAPRRGPGGRGPCVRCQPTWSAPGMGGVLGACHGLDLPLVFGNLDRGHPAMLIGETPSPEGEILSARMRAA